MTGGGQVRFALLGGFLGSGKTTALLRLAQEQAARGRRVGIITNDQSEDLVDTATFRAAGWTTEEVPGGCFCCRFEQLLAAAGRLEDGLRPDLLLAEPVGSCTDLVATVLRPLRELYGARFSLAPYVTLLDPARARRSLGAQAGLSAKVTYLYAMQQHEADVVVLNKVDLLDPGEREELLALAARHFPRAELLAASARSGEGFPALHRLLEGDAAATARTVPVDYDVYAAGEARLGWVNARVRLAAGAPGGFPPGELLKTLAGSLQAALAARAAEPAHVKLLLETDAGAPLRANLLGCARPPELTVPPGAPARADTGTLLINARVEEDPAALRASVEATLQETARAQDLVVDLETLAHLAPPRPVPSYRWVDGKLQAREARPQA